MLKGWDTLEMLFSAETFLYDSNLAFYLLVYLGREDPLEKGKATHSSILA